MAGLVPAIHAVRLRHQFAGQDILSSIAQIGYDGVLVDGRVKPGHDDLSRPRINKTTPIAIRAAISIDKIRNVRYVLLLTESLPARRSAGAGRGEAAAV
jgi:hypothetical protein